MKIICFKKLEVSMKQRLITYICIHKETLFSMSNEDIIYLSPNMGEIYARKSNYICQRTPMDFFGTVFFFFKLFMGNLKPTKIS